MTDTPINQEKAGKQLENQIEALLFASDTPLSARRISTITGEESIARIKGAIEDLRTFYRDNNRSFTIIEIAGGYQIATLPEYSSLISRLYKSKRKSRLSQPALETLAIIAYKQPISRMQIEAIRGVNCEGVIATLLDRELIAITGRGEGVGKPYLYSTTRKFLEYLGLKDYRDLPSLEEIEKKIESELPAGVNSTNEEEGESEGEKIHIEPGEHEE